MTRSSLDILIAAYVLHDTELHYLREEQEVLKYPPNNPHLLIV